MASSSCCILKLQLLPAPCRLKAGCPADHRPNLLPALRVYHQLVISSVSGRGVITASAPTHASDPPRKYTSHQLQQFGPGPAPAPADHDHPVSFSPSAQARVVVVVGGSQMSPWAHASWLEVLHHLSHKLTRSDPELQMIVLDVAHEDRLGALLQTAHLLVAVGIQSVASAHHILRAAAHTHTLVAFDSLACLRSRLGGVRVPPSHNSFYRLLEALPIISSSQRAAAKMRVIQEIWHRRSSDNILLALQLLVNYYVRPVRSLQKLEGKGSAFWVRAVRRSWREMVACLLDPQAREALVDLAKCDPRDQVCTYRCIVQHESVALQALSFSLLEEGNCLELDAGVPMHLAVGPIQSFRGDAVTHDLAESLLIGWAQKLGWSWKVAGSTFPFASDFKSHTQTFYRERPGSTVLRYDTVFQVMGKNGQPNLRERHCIVKKAQQQGTFFVSFMDNGIMIREFWTIIDAAKDLSWVVILMLGVAPRVGQTFNGAIVCTPNGDWPSQLAMDNGQFYSALDKCNIKDWEISRVDHSPHASSPSITPCASCRISECHCVN